MITKGGSHQTRLTGRKQVLSPLYSLSSHDVLYLSVRNIGMQCQQRESFQQCGASHGYEEGLMSKALPGAETPGIEKNVTLTVTQPVFLLSTSVSRKHLQTSRSKL